MPLHPRTCTLLYSISCLLDALDGYAARYFEQSTRFGAVLDMVTDRCTTACLLVFLASAFPRWSLLFQGLISLDLASHYMHMYATLSMGGENHKKVDASRSFILNLYYTNKVRPGCRPPGKYNTNIHPDSSFPVLLSERSLLHCPIPFILLLTQALSLPPTNKWNRQHPPTRKPFANVRGQHIFQPMECRCS